MKKCGILPQSGVGTVVDYRRFSCFFLLGVMGVVTSLGGLVGCMPSSEDVREVVESSDETRVVEDFHPSGALQVRRKQRLIDGEWLDDGVATWYFYGTDQRSAEGPMSRGKYCGLWRLWDMEGEEAMRTLYVEDEKVFQVVLRDGQPAKAGPLYPDPEGERAPLRHGTWYQWASNGSITLIEYKYGRLQDQ
jgi:hypothetical protein